MAETLEVYLSKMLAGDRSAREVVFQHAAGQLERLARKMLRRFPRRRLTICVEDGRVKRAIRAARAEISTVSLIRR